MIMKNELLKRLQAIFDLNIYEVKIWVSLLSKGVAPAGELSEISGVPRSRCYDVLESLEKRGFVLMKIGKPIEYIAVKPEEVLRRVKNQVTMDSEAHMESLDNARNTDVFDELQLLYKQGIEHVEPTNLSAALKGRKNLYNHLKTMLNEAEKKVVIATSSAGLMRKYGSIKNLLRRLHERGIEVKILAPITEENKKVAQEMRKYVDIKDNHGLKARFVIVDGKEIMFMISDDIELHEDSDIGIWVNTPFFAKALDRMFEMSWKKI